MYIMIPWVRGRSIEGAGVCSSEIVYKAVSERFGLLVDIRLQVAKSEGWPAPKRSSSIFAIALPVGSQQMADSHLVDHNRAPWRDKWSEVMDMTWCYFEAGKKGSCPVSKAR